MQGREDLLIRKATAEVSGRREDGYPPGMNDKTTDEFVRQGRGTTGGTVVEHARVYEA